MEGAAQYPLQMSSSRESRHSTPSSRRNIRARLACVRCARRKIRCDGAIPSCSACLKSGSICVDGGNQDSIESPRAQNVALSARVQWLESIVRVRCPDVDLEAGPKLLGNVPTNSAVLVQENIAHNTAQEAHTMNADSLGARNVSTLSDTDHTSQQAEMPSADQPEGGLAHEIGLVSLSAGTDPKYIGPSSGYFFAKLLLATASRQGQSVESSQPRGFGSRSAFLLPRDSLDIPPTPLPHNVEYVIQLSETYFETIHPQYPFLHRPSHMKLIQNVYDEENPSSLASFQVNMVLAISATVLSRRLKVPLSGEGFCANAMKHFGNLSIENSLKGLQSILLLLIYTIHSPSMGLNVWYLNYQCIAALLDLGLQRNVRASKSMSLLDQEMRTRVFWVIYTLDRTVATIMGRPIGLRDEACELRLPMDVDDDSLTRGQTARIEGQPPTHITNAIHLFKLAQLNSEIKYILHSISHDPPPYTYPQITDMQAWQAGMISRLHQWLAEIPVYQNNKEHITIVSEIRYHGVMMLLLRPSPANRKPTSSALRLCFESATRSIRLYNQLYRSDLLAYTWELVHSIFLSTITMLYCIWTIPDIAAQTKLDVLMADLKTGSNVLSATGEYWSEAKRSRDVLDELSSATVHWIIESRARSAAGRGPLNSRPEIRQSQETTDINMTMLTAGGYPRPSSGTVSTDLDSTYIDEESSQYPGLDFYTSLFGDSSSGDPMDFSNQIDVNAIMQGVFSDFQPSYEFGQDFNWH